MTWAQGDFDYNGSVDVADLGALATYYGDSLAGGSTNASPTAIAAAVSTSLVASSNGGSNVPEPSSVTILAITAAGLLGRRCRSARQPIHVTSSRGEGYANA
jgi:hypothetical protein